MEVFNPTQAGLIVGTSTERGAMIASTIKVTTQFYETDTGLTYFWDGTSWQVNKNPALTLAYPPTAVSASVAAQNTFTNLLTVSKNELISVSISGTFSATVSLQRSFDGGTTWFDVFQSTTPAQKTYQADETCKIRLGVKTGDYTSGTAVCRLGQ